MSKPSIASYIGFYETSLEWGRDILSRHHVRLGEFQSLLIGHSLVVAICRLYTDYRTIRETVPDGVMRFTPTLEDIVSGNGTRA
jgi:hypothetical protein